MLKTEWEEGLKRLEAILKDAKDTAVKSAKDIEELEFTISKYREQIECIKE